MTVPRPTSSFPSTVYWLQGGGCGGDTMALLGADTPSLPDLLGDDRLSVLWHPSWSPLTAPAHDALVASLAAGEAPLDVLCVEGNVVNGPHGSGGFQRRGGRAVRDLVADLARRARFVVAVGTCASFGGFGAASELEATGLQFLRDEPGGLLGPDFRSSAGLPVVNLPGCPCHPAIVTGVLDHLVRGAQVSLSPLNTPLAWYGGLIHQGCTRNEYHEYRVEDEDYGGHACLFFHMGCRGPLTHGQCNNLLWNRRSSKTRAGVPCDGCTRPDFPSDEPFHTTRNIEGIPLDLPEGVDRAHYLAYKGMAAAAAPQRLRRRLTRV